MPACPPGCAYQSDFDGITVLASSATLVAIVKVNWLPEPSSLIGGNVSIDKVLQGNANHNGSPPTKTELPHLLSMAKARVGKTYLIFTSFNRGGSCVSALFGYEPTAKTATFISQWGGPGDQIPLPGRTATIPAAINLHALRMHMYPTGAVTYPDDAAEWFCPGP
jgi:hypothetical protein